MLHSQVITTYTNLMLLAIMATIVFVTDMNLDIVRTFGYTTFISLLGMSLCNVGSQTFRFMAVQRCDISKVTQFTNTKVIFQFMADLFLFNETFN